MHKHLPASDTRRTALTARWQTALHEAAHVVVACRMNSWTTTCSAVVVEAGHGFSRLPAGLTGHSHIIAVAAGRWGARLAKVFPRPARRRRPRAVQTHLRPEIAAMREKGVDEIETGFCLSLTGDDETVAAYVIRFQPGDSADWTRRHRRIHAEARLLTWMHRDEIRKLAVRLFHRGHVELPGSPADNAFFAPSSGGAK